MKYFKTYYIATAALCLMLSQSCTSDDAAPWSSDESIDLQLLTRRETRITRVDTTTTFGDYWLHSNALTNGTSDVTTFGLFGLSGSVSPATLYHNSLLTYNAQTSGFDNETVAYFHNQVNTFFAYGPWMTTTQSNEEPYVAIADNVFHAYNLPFTTRTDLLVAHSPVTANTNPVRIFMDHARARLDIKFRISSAHYAALRNIEITKVEVLNLPAGSGSLTFDLDSPLKGTSWNTALPGCSAQETLTDTLLLTEESDIYSLYGSIYVAPNLRYKSGGIELQLNVTYNTYDKGTLEVRDLQTVRTITPSYDHYTQTTGGSQCLSVAGSCYSINIAIDPAFIYELSDNDQNLGFVVPLVP